MNLHVVCAGHLAHLEKAPLVRLNPRYYFIYDQVQRSKILNFAITLCFYFLLWLSEQKLKFSPTRR
jgi:hypothetical protein